MGFRGADLMDEHSKAEASSRGETSPIAFSKTVLGVMQSPVWTLQGGDTLRKAIKFLRTAETPYFPVLKGEKLIGILCGCGTHLFLSSPIQDAIAGRDEGALDRLRVQEIMRDAPVSIGPYHSVVAAAQLLLERGICALPVVEEQKVVGIVTQADILRALVERV